MVALDQEDLERLLGLPEGLRVEAVRVSGDEFSAPGIRLVISGIGMMECPPRSPLYIERWEQFAPTIKERVEQCKKALAGEGFS